MITRPDKENGVVLLDREYYNKLIYDIISDTGKFKKLSKDPTIQRESKLQRYLRKIKAKGFFTDDLTYNNVYPTGSSTARIYGLPKLHKLKSDSDVLKLRPIISSIGTYNYNLSKFLANKLTPFIDYQFCATDSFSFVKEIKEVSFNSNFLISFDVCSLFTMIPLSETIDIAVNLIFERQPGLKMTKTELKTLFQFATSGTHFLFNSEYFDQIDGVSMGSPLGPVLANLFMSHNEGSWIENYKGVKPFYYRRYVDDIFCIFSTEVDAKHFLSYLNLQHKNIRFTFESENEGKLSFLDVLIFKKNDKFETPLFRKTTFTGLLTNFVSYIPLDYKLGLIKTLIHRCFQICSTWQLFHTEIVNIKNILTKNCFPPDLVDREIKKFLSSKFSEPNEKNSLKEQNYFTLPYIGNISKFTKTQISKLCLQFCKNTKFKLVFTPFKIGSLFSSKDPVPLTLSSSVVYKFICRSCNASYIGETQRHLNTRIKEHLYSDKNSHVLQHLIANDVCHKSSDPCCFTIIDRASSPFRLKIKEALHIGWQNPVLNKQVKNVMVGINV